MYTLTELLNIAKNAYAASCEQVDTVDEREEQDMYYENNVRGLDEEVRGMATKDDVSALQDFRTWAEDKSCGYIQMIAKAVDVELAYVSRD